MRVARAVLSGYLDCLQVLPHLGERFSVLEKLGLGGMGVVYRVFDQKRSAEVALKVLHGDKLHPLGLTRFKREFRAAARLNHPGCVRVFEMGNFGERSFVTMEYMPGGSLAKVKALSSQQAVSIALQVLASLDHIHSKQIIHRDIKPHNILLAEPLTPGGDVPRVQVSDFGIVQMSDSQLDHAFDGVTGSLPYLAPEQLTEAHADPRTDLYALGVVLYELLAQRLPFEPKGKVSFAEWRRARLSSTAVPLEQVNPDIHEPLARFVDQLLEAAPERRFATAAAAFDELDRRCGVEVRGRLPPLPPLARSSYLAAPRFVGREKDLASIEGELRRVLAAGPDESRGKFVLFISGEAGIGKTRVLHRLRSTLETMGAQICVGQCRAEGGTPFEPLASLFSLVGLYDPRSPVHASPDGVDAGAEVAVTSLSATGWASRSTVAARNTVDLLSRFLSEAASVRAAEEAPSSSASKPTSDERQPEQHWQLHRHVADSVIALSRARPFALLLEDTHWADSSTLELLSFLVRSVVAASHDKERFPICMLLTRRMAPELPAMRALEEAARAHGVASTFDMGPLDLASTRELVASMLMCGKNQTVEELSGWLMSHADGNPLYVAQMLHALQGSGRLVRTGEQWRAELRDVRSADLPTTVRNAIGDRASRFATNTKRMLASAAVLGREFHLRILSEVSDIEPLLLLDCLDEAIRAAFVLEVDRDPERFVFAHDRIREAIYEQFSASEARILHRRAMVALERSFAHAPEAAASLAHHSLQCGELEKAYRYHCAAGRHAFREYAFADAADLYTKALEIADQASISVTTELYQSLADAAFQCGRYDLAEENYRRRLAALEEPIQRAEVLSAIADLEYRRGNPLGSAELHEQVLRTMGCHVPTSRADMAFALAKNVVTAVGHASRPRKARRQEDDGLLPRQVITRTCGSLPEVVYFFDTLRALLYNFMGLNTAEEIGPGRELAHACAQQGALLAMFGFHRAARYYQARAAEALKVSGTPVDRAWAGTIGGMQRACLGDVAYGRREAELACEILARCRDPHRLREALMIVSETALAVGDLAHAERSARAILRLAEEQSDSRGRDRARGWGLYLLGVCAGRRGDHSQAVESLRESSALTQQTDDVLYHLAAEGRLVVELAIGGALEEAAERGRLAATELRRRDIRHPFLVVDGPFLVAAALLKQRDGALSAEFLAAARRVRWLRSGVARIMRVTLPVYLAGCGAWSIAHGGEARGTRELARASEIASGHELSGVLLDVHRVGAAVLPIDSPAGRWHRQARDELRAGFSLAQPAQAPRVADHFAN